MKKFYYFKKIKSPLYSLKKHLKILPLKIQVMFKQYSHFMNYVNHDKAKI